MAGKNRRRQRKQDAREQGHSSRPVVPGPEYGPMDGVEVSVTRVTTENLGDVLSVFDRADSIEISPELRERYG